MRFRFLFIISFFLILYGALETNLIKLQLKNGDYYINKVGAMNEEQDKLNFRRGRILLIDKHNNNVPVALNKEYPVIFAIPKEIENPKSVASKIAPIFNLNEEKLINAFSNKKSLFYPLMERADEKTKNDISQLKLGGVSIKEGQFRDYPYRSLASHAIGFVGLNESHPAPSGLYGIEKFYDKELADEKNIQLTIDRSIEISAEDILKSLMEKFEAVGGTIIVMEPYSGRIIALANSPTFDPNKYNESKISNFINPAVQSTYEPGSVFKPLTMVAGIDSGIITPDTTFYDNGGVTLNGKTITNWDGKAHGKVTMTNVIEESINTGAVFAVRKIGNDKFLDYVKKFGFGETTNIDLPDEVTGSFKNIERKGAREIDYATASFGQGVGVTPIQLITAFSSIANGGLLMRPYINADKQPYVVRRVMSEETSKKVVAMMESAVEKARVASMPQHRIAGKTGTAQVADLQYGGYTEDFVHTYIGFGPVSNPKFVALLKLDRPKAMLAGYTVVPAFKELSRFILDYYNVPPDKAKKQPVTNN